MSGPGTKRRFAAMPTFGRYWRRSGHRARCGRVDPKRLNLIGYLIVAIARFLNVVGRRALKPAGKHLVSDELANNVDRRPKSQGKRYDFATTAVSK
jgi:hypothetical protein